MRFLTLVFISLMIYMSACKEKGPVDTKSIDSLITITDSLFIVVQDLSDITSNHFYSLIDDSLKTDSLAQMIDIPNSMGIYQFMELSINDFNELISETKSEIFFAKDQLNSLRNDRISLSIDNSEYLKEILSMSDMVLFLENRVDSNIFIIDSKYNSVFFSINDSIK